MSTLTTAPPAPVRSAHPVKQMVVSHPLVAFFVIAFAATWLCIIPIVLSQRGLGLIALPEPILLALFILTTFIGPLPAALLVTGMTEGRAGVRQLLRRMVQWRVGPRWYLLVVIGFPLVFLLGLIPVLGAAPLAAAVQNWPLLLTGYLPLIAFGLVYPAVGEEPGWRGFALPRLQRLHGPLLGSLILGTLHAVWHLPAYFIPGAISDGGFDPVVFVANSLAVVGWSIVWTWLFNNAGGSVFFAMFVHATSNATSNLIPQLVNGHDTPDPFFGCKVAIAVAVLLIIATRGRLGYKQEPVAAVGAAVPAPA